ncbi:glia maturation factor beta-like isoform X2 [Ylistrum balloti]|uniref:glia maturation factor beta-like isoform X2 n=1 Tax=Ylistrum balloti TaxID=509963 RepID=UPI002905803C|nr:glia maturation factor beta-like isoform X2 [Ylistrum balloti]
MAASINFSTIPEEVKKQIKLLRFRQEKTIAAIILKINKDADQVEIETELEDCTIEDIQESLPDHLPRYIIISYRYHHSDNRISFPFFFVYFAPRGGNTALQVRYAGTTTKLQQELGMTKFLKIEETEGLTSEVLDAKVEFYR